MSLCYRNNAEGKPVSHSIIKLLTCYVPQLHKITSNMKFLSAKWDFSSAPKIDDFNIWLYTIVDYLNSQKINSLLNSVLKSM